MQDIGGGQVDFCGARPERVTLDGPAVPGSEDFAFMPERVPGSYLFIGNGDGDGAGACMVHNPGYDFNDDNVGVVRARTGRCSRSVPQGELTGRFNVPTPRPRPGPLPRARIAIAPTRARG